MEPNKQKEWILKRSAKRFGLTLNEYLRHIETKKRCHKCEKWKVFSDFPKDKSRHDGLHVRCFECQRVKNPRKPVMPEWAKEALRERNRMRPPSLGRKLTDNHKKRLSDLRKEEGANGTGSFYGKNNPNWKGGISPEIHMARTVSAYREWRTAVFEKDHYACRRCGDDRGGNLHAHHIKKFSDFPGLRYEVSNGETLCFDCHAKEHDVPNSFRKRSAVRRKKS